MSVVYQERAGAINTYGGVPAFADTPVQG